MQGRSGRFSGNEGHLGHLAADKGQLALEGNLHGTEVVTGHEAYAAEDAFIGAHHVEVLGGGALVPGVDHKAGDAVQEGGAHEVGPHIGGGAAGDAAAALDAALGLVNFLGRWVIHARLDALGVEELVGMNPGLGVEIEVAEPDAGIHGEVAHQFEDRQGHEGDLIGHILGQGLAGQPWAAIDEHGAGAADGGPADKVEHQGRVLLLPEAIQSDEKAHAHGFFQMKVLHPRGNLRGDGMVTKDGEGEMPFSHGHSPLYI